MDAIQAAEEQSLFRKVNERVWAISNSFDAMQDVKFLCECPRRDCTEQVSMSLTAYEGLRRVPAHFAVSPSPGHVFLEGDVSSRNERVTSWSRSSAKQAPRQPGSIRAGEEPHSTRSTNRT